MCCDWGERGPLSWTALRYQAWIMNDPSLPLLLPNKRMSHIKDQRWLWSIILICATDSRCLCSTSVRLESGSSRSQMSVKATCLRIVEDNINATSEWPKTQVTCRKQRTECVKTWCPRSPPLHLKAIHWVAEYFCCTSMMGPELLPAIRMHPIWLGWNHSKGARKLQEFYSSRVI